MGGEPKRVGLGALFDDERGQGWSKTECGWLEYGLGRKCRVGKGGKAFGGPKGGGVGRLWVGCVGERGFRMSRSGRCRGIKPCPNTR